MSILQQLAQYLSACPALGSVGTGSLQEVPCAYLLAGKSAAAQDITGARQHTLQYTLVVRRTALESSDDAALADTVQHAAAWVNAKDAAGQLPLLAGYTADSLAAEGGTMLNTDDSGIATANMRLVLQCREGEE